MNRDAKDKTDLSLVDKIELARVYQPKVNRGIILTYGGEPSNLYLPLSGNNVFKIEIFRPVNFLKFIVNNKICQFKKGFGTWLFTLFFLHLSLFASPVHT